MQKLTDKIAIITGASRGLGKAMAVELAKEGARVAVVARTVEAGKGSLPGTIHETIETIIKMGGEARAVQCDVTDENDVTAMVRQIKKHYGRIDILINNAGITTPEPFLKLTTKKWDLVIAVNLKGTFLCCQAVLPHMVGQKSGHIINLSSVLAKTVKFSIPYGSTKAAIERLTLGLAKELKTHNIAVNALCPNFTVTEAVTTFLKDVDTTDWQSPEMWGRYAALVAAEDIGSLTGRILDEPALKKLFGSE